MCFGSIKSEFLKLSIGYRVLVCLIAVWGLLSVLYALGLRTANRGDAMEYVYMTEAFSKYAAPDLRQEAIDEVARKLKWIERTAPSQPYSGFFEANNGKWYSYHFWFYSLLATPIKMMLEVMYIDPYRCFAVLNCILFVAVIYHLYKYLNLEKEKKILFIGLVVINPVVWYLQWPHTEVYSYVLVLYSLLFYSNNKYAYAILMSSFGAIHNPPVIILGLFIGILALFKFLKSKDYIRIVYCILAGVPASMPFIFYYLYFDTPNLIVKIGGAGLQHVSFQKIYDFFFDFNFGLLAYVPLVLFLFIIAALKAIIKRNFTKFGLIIVVILMMVLSAQTTNWNHGCDGMNRYLVWMLPIIFFVVTLLLNLNNKIIYSVIASQAIIIFLYGWPDCRMRHVEFTPLAKFVLNYAPVVYSPEPSVFVERAFGDEISYRGSNLMPFIYANEDEPKKIYTDYNGLLRLDKKCEIIDIEWYNSILTKFSDNREDYINPPKGAVKLHYVKVRELSPEESRASYSLVRSPSIAAPSAFFYPIVSVKNEGTATWFTGSLSRGTQGIFVSYHWYDETGTKMVYNDGYRTKLPYPLKPSESIEIELMVRAPGTAGKYVLAVEVLQEHVRWFSDLGNPMLKIPITVTSAQQQSQ